jgi:hypothetical protein
MTAGEIAAGIRPGLGATRIFPWPGPSAAGGAGLAPPARHTADPCLPRPGFPPAATGFGRAETARGPRAAAAGG